MAADAKPLRAAERKLREVRQDLPNRAGCHPDLTPKEKTKWAAVEAATAAYRGAMDAMHKGPTGWIAGLRDGAWCMHELTATFAVLRSATAAVVQERCWGDIHIAMRTIREHLDRVAASPDPRAGTILATHAEPAYQVAGRLKAELLRHQLNEDRRAELFLDLCERVDTLYGVLAKIGEGTVGEPLTPGEQAYWNVLKGTALKDQDAADKLTTSVQQIKNHRDEIRRKRSEQSILRKSQAGFYRPDSPPDWSTVTMPRKRRYTKT